MESVGTGCGNCFETTVYRLSLVKERTVEYTTTSPKAIVEMMDKVFDAGALPEEHLWCVAVDTKCHVLGLFEVSHGATNWSAASPKDVFKRVLLCGGVGFFLVHNHPSGDVHPSKEDNQMTRKMHKGGEILELTLMDHIIIGDKDYYSYAEEGGLNV